LRVLARSAPGQTKRLLDEATANALRRMLRVTTTRGTSRKAFRERKGRPNVPAAGKTGTLGVSKPRRLLSWFTGFAPARDPEVAVAVMLANDYKWWRKANQVARDALDAYFESR
jgi:cell division protein FtsI/penicillin-binding protein 2